MRSARAVSIITLGLGVVSFLCLVGYYLALHDIFRDYVSREVLQNLRIASAEAIPQWTACAGEWRLLGMAFWPMLLFHVIFFGAFLLHRQRRDGMSAEGSSRFDPASAHH